MLYQEELDDFRGSTDPVRNCSPKKRNFRAPGAFTDLLLASLSLQR